MFPVSVASLGSLCQVWLLLLLLLLLLMLPLLILLLMLLLAPMFMVLMLMLLGQRMPRGVLADALCVRRLVRRPSSPRTRVFSINLPSLTRLLHATAATSPQPPSRTSPPPRPPPQGLPAAASISSCCPPLRQRIVRRSCDWYGTHYRRQRSR
eukprot:COSAG02_NODE_29051_length_576_cov_47.228512_1_plen_152_part_10